MTDSGWPLTPWGFYKLPKVTNSQIWTQFAKIRAEKYVENMGSALLKKEHLLTFLEVLVLLSRMYSFLYSLYSFGSACPVFFQFKSWDLAQFLHLFTNFTELHYLAHFCTNFNMITMMTLSHVDVYVIHMKNRFCTMCQLWHHVLNSLTLNKKAIWPPLFKMWDLVTEKWWIIAIKHNFVDF